MKRNEYMTIKNLLGHLTIANNQHVKITDETKRCTYISEDGCYAFEGYDEGAFTMWEYISKMRVLGYKFDADEIHIYAE